MHGLTLSKIFADMLAYRLNEKHFLHPSVRITYYCEREGEACNYFNQKESIAFCHNIEGLLYTLVQYPMIRIIGVYF